MKTDINKLLDNMDYEYLDWLAGHLIETIYSIENEPKENQKFIIKMKLSDLVSKVYWHSGDLLHMFLPGETLSKDEKKLHRHMKSAIKKEYLRRAKLWSEGANIRTHH